MKNFLSERKYLLSNASAKKIYKEIKSLPIVDPHNHANVAEIADNKNFSDPWQLFAATDHYVWEVLRKRNVPEKYISGGAMPKEKWLKMASVFPEIAGNPVYEWIHLDLRRYLGIDDIISPENGLKIWDKASAALQKKGARPQALLKKIAVETMCSTDDPVDTLKHHARMNEQAQKIFIHPTWRPDKIMNIRSKNWKDYLYSLEKKFNAEIDNLDKLMEVLKQSHDYFAAHGCVASDHGVQAPPTGIGNKDTAEKIFKMAKTGVIPSIDEAKVYINWIFGEMAGLDASKNWVFQIHIGAVRDVRDSIFNNIGPDAGGDVSDHFIDILSPLRSFLNRFDDKLKIVLYCLEPGHQATLATIARTFGSKVRLGAAWWLCDTPIGMKRQLEYIGSVDLFANFAGMVSDSRKLLSYGSRFEVFRRVLSDVLGEMVGKGQMPLCAAIELAEKMSYSEPKKFYNL
jgi:glucuronate isomerase